MNKRADLVFAIAMTVFTMLATAFFAMMAYDEYGSAVARHNAYLKDPQFWMTPPGLLDTYGMPIVAAMTAVVLGGFSIMQWLWLFDNCRARKETP